MIKHYYYWVSQLLQLIISNFVWVPSKSQLNPMRAGKQTSPEQPHALLQPAKGGVGKQCSCYMKCLLGDPQSGHAPWPWSCPWWCPWPYPLQCPWPWPWHGWGTGNGCGALDLSGLYAVPYSTQYRMVRRYVRIFTNIDKILIKEFKKWQKYVFFQKGM